VLTRLFSARFSRRRLRLRCLAVSCVLTAVDDGVCWEWVTDIIGFDESVDSAILAHSVSELNDGSEAAVLSEDADKHDATGSEDEEEEGNAEEVAFAMARSPGEATLGPSEPVEGGAPLRTNRATKKPIV